MKSIIRSVDCFHLITGRTLNKSDLRSEYSGVSVNFNKTAIGIQANLSYSGGIPAMGTGVGNSVSSNEIGFAYYKPVEGV